MMDTKKGINLLKLPDKIMAVIVANNEPVTQRHFEEQLPDVPVTELLPVLNTMQKKGQLEVLVNADRTLSWQLRTIKNIEKIKSLTDLDEKLVYNCIRKNGNDGATVRTISLDTKIQQVKLPKILKSLIARKLIKELPVMAGNKQKIYLLAELEPSKTLAANTLFAGESGVDVEFVSMLRTACLKYINDKANTASTIADPFKRRNASYVTVEEIHNFITASKLCTVYHDPLFPNPSVPRFSNPSTIPPILANVQQQNSLRIVTSDLTVPKTSQTGQKTCQVDKLTKTPLGTIPLPDSRFDCVHIYIVDPLPL
ncbi:hypothetical protein ACTXT7_011217 [Hymenolepis weldensis]